MGYLMPYRRTVGGTILTIDEGRRRFITFLKDIELKVNIVAQLESELAKILQFSKLAITTLPANYLY